MYTYMYVGLISTALSGEFSVAPSKLKPYSACASVCLKMSLLYILINSFSQLFYIYRKAILEVEFNRSKFRKVHIDDKENH